MLLVENGIIERCRAGSPVSADEKKSIFLSRWQIQVADNALSHCRGS
ncbi:hypothetical protein [Methylogaea oryzae]|nr:hypothetical protein [Methylogaea oryzae]